MDFDSQIEFAGSVVQGVDGGGVRTEIGVEVTEDSNANGVAHAVIVLERAAAGTIAVLKVLEPVREVEKDVEAEQGQGGAAPDH